MIQFLMDGEVHTIKDIDPTLTVLQWLRGHVRKTGTKEGCAEGDCGACTVVIGDLVGDEVRYRAVNACIYFMPMLQGKELITVEALGSTKELHPIQKALAENHGSQCGFCTPGFVMSLFAKYQDSDPALPENVDDLLAGNLCRCTGYGPIQETAETVSAEPEVKARFGNDLTLEKLKSIQALEAVSYEHDDALFEGKRMFFAPKTKSDLVNVLGKHPDATIVAGATDVGLWVTKHHQTLKTVVSLQQLSELQYIKVSESGDLKIGAGVTYSDAWAALAKMHPDLGELVRRISSVQVRNSGTIGGNIANGSPIGDMPPALIALDATLVLMSDVGERRIPLDDFFIDYGKQDLLAGEFVESVEIPALNMDKQYFRNYKISKRFDQDISAVCGAFLFEIRDDVIADVRIAFGGMAATPKRALATENALKGHAWSEASIKQAMPILAQDYQPISDMRASETYRLKVAKNLLFKAFLEYKEEERTRILECGGENA